MFHLNKFRGFILGVATTFCFSHTFAFDVSVKANVSNAQIFIGDMFEYEIQVAAPESATVDLPSFVGNLGNFEVKEIKNEKLPNKNGSANFIWHATLNTFISGDFAIAPQKVIVALGNDTVNVNTDPVAVKVSMRTTGDETDILDIADPIADTRLPQWVYVLLIALGVILLIVVGWLLHKKFAKNKGTKQLPPYEEAIISLQNLRQKSLLEQGLQADYFMALGYIVRRYIERRFNTDILDATITELKQRMSHVAGLQQAYKESIINLATETEPVKFAKMKLAEDACRKWDEWADRLLNDTKPIPEKANKK